MTKRVILGKNKPRKVKRKAVRTKKKDIIEKVNITKVTKLGADFSRSLEKLNKVERIYLFNLLNKAMLMSDSSFCKAIVGIANHESAKEILTHLKENLERFRRDIK